MSTVISTHILGVSSGPLPRHPLRADCYMDLWKNIHSGLRLCIKIRYVYIPSLTFEKLSLYKGKKKFKNNDIRIVCTLNGVQAGMIKKPLLFQETEANMTVPPSATIVSFVELLGPETSPNPKLSVEAIKALVSEAALATAKRLSEDKNAFYTIKDADPLDEKSSIFVRRFQFDWVRFRNISPPVPTSGPSPRLSSRPMGPESIVCTASDTTVWSNFDRFASNLQHVRDGQPEAQRPGWSIVERLPPKKQPSRSSFQLPTPMGMTAIVAGTIAAIELYRNF